MHRTRQSKTWLTSALLVAGCAWHVTFAAPSEKTAAATTPTAKAHPLLAVVVPESHFVSEPSVGKDPFFPDSTRRLPSLPITQKAVVTEVNRASLLTLRGVSGPEQRRIALINNLTFAPGEEGTVRTSAGLLKIRVVSIADKAVTVLIDGDSRPRELVLDDKIPDSIQIQTSNQIQTSQVEK